MATLQMRVDDDLKKKSDDLFQSLGMDTSTAIRIFLTFAIEHNGIPFDVRHAPEDLSLEKAISDSRTRKNLHGSYATAADAVALACDLADRLLAGEGELL